MLLLSVQMGFPKKRHLFRGEMGGCFYCKVSGQNETQRSKQEKPDFLGDFFKNFQTPSCSMSGFLENMKTKQS